MSLPGFDGVELRTPRLHLRPLRAADAPALLALHADAEVMRHSNMPPWTGIEQASRLIESLQAGMAAGRHLALGLVPTGQGELVGTCTLFGLVPSSRRAEVGFALAKPAWRQGYMSEALRALLDHAFTVLDLNRVEADTDPRNLPSVRLLERLGFVREGLLRERWIVAGEASDAALYGLLRRDWATRR
jgi:RimJ/RimL family protein N-acetyltransferase